MNVVNIIILAILIVSLALIGFMAPRFRRWLLLLLASQVPMTMLGIFMSTNKLQGRSFIVDVIEILIWSAITGVLVWLAYRTVKKSELIPPMNLKQFRWGHIVIGFLMLYGSGILLNIISTLLTNAAISTGNQESLNDLAAQVPFIIFLFATLIGGGFFEELVFRVGVFEMLLPNRKNWAALVSIVLFTVIHMPSDIWSAAIYGTYAVILTAFYYRYRNFYINMGMHVLLNFTAGMLYFLSQVLHLF